MKYLEQQQKNRIRKLVKKKKKEREIDWDCHCVVTSDQRGFTLCDPEYMHNSTLTSWAMHYTQNKRGTFYII